MDFQSANMDWQLTEEDAHAVIMEVVDALYNFGTIMLPILTCIIYIFCIVMLPIILICNFKKLTYKFCRIIFGIRYKTAGPLVRYVLEPLIHPFGPDATFKPKGGVCCNN